jgi:hypothetical protein
MRYVFWSRRVYDDDCWGPLPVIRLICAAVGLIPAKMLNVGLLVVYSWVLEKRK